MDTFIDDAVSKFKYYFKGGTSPLSEQHLTEKARNKGNNLNSIDLQARQKLFNSAEPINNEQIKNALNTRLEVLKHQAENSPLGPLSAMNGNTIGNLIEQTQYAIDDLSKENPTGIYLKNIILEMQKQTEEDILRIGKHYDVITTPQMKSLKEKMPQIIDYLDEFK